MKVLIIGYREIKTLLTMDQCIKLMEGVFRSIGLGQTVVPQRQVLWQPDGRGALGLMPAYVGDPKALGAKVVSVFPGNAATAFESHQGPVMLFDTSNGQLLALIDAGEITAIRTAAVSGLATQLLSRPDSARLAILGAGTQAMVHLEAMLAVRPVREVRVWSRSPERAQAFVHAATERYPIQVTAAPTAQAAVHHADLICTVTGATSPILREPWVSAGAHINAVGASVPGFRELDTAVVIAGRLYADRRESALNEADDIRIPLMNGDISPQHLRGELADLVLGTVDGRTDQQDITLFKSLGLAAEDVAAAHYIYTQALARTVGTWVEFSGSRYEGSARPPHRG